MAEIRTVTTLTSKREEIERAIDAYEHELAQLRVSLSAVTTTIALFETNAETPPSYVNLRVMFRRGDMTKTLLAALKDEGPLDTRALTVRLLRAKGFNADDAVLRKTVGLRVVHALRQQLLYGKVTDAGRAKGGVRIWALP